MLLKMLHPVPVPDGMFEPELQAFAVVLDKYQCQAACVVNAPAWMKTLLYRFGFDLGLANFVGLAIAFRSHEVSALATMGVALTSAEVAKEHEPNHLAVRYRIEHTPLAHIIPDDVINRIEELRAKSITEIISVVARPEAIAGITLSPTKKKDAAAPDLVYDNVSFWHHDEQTIANYYFVLGVLGPLGAPSAQPVLDVPFSLPHDLCTAAYELKELNADESSILVVPGSDCPSRRLIDEIYRLAHPFVFAALRRFSGLYLDRAICDNGRCPIGSKCCQRSDPPGYNPYCELPYHVMLLFGRFIGAEFHEQGSEFGENSFKSLVGNFVE